MLIQGDLTQDGGRGVLGEGLPFLAWAQVPRQPRRISRPVVYGLVDPRDETLRYVGATFTALDSRLEHHLEHPTNVRMGTWFLELSRLGLRPWIRLVANVPNGNWQQAEMYWIAWVRLRGNLYNIDPGGKYRDDTGAIRPKMAKAAQRMERYVRTGDFQGPPKRINPKKKRLKVAKTPAGRLAIISARQMASLRPAPAPKPRPSPPPMVSKRDRQSKARTENYARLIKSRWR